MNLDTFGRSLGSEWFRRSSSSIWAASEDPKVCLLVVCDEGFGAGGATTTTPLPKSSGADLTMYLEDSLAQHGQGSVFAKMI